MILSSKILKGMVDDIVSIDRFNTFQIKLMIRNHQDPEFSIDDAHLYDLTFEHDALTNTTDDIQLRIGLRIDQLQDISARQSDLYVDMVFEYTDLAGSIVLEEPPLQLRYNAFIHDISSITKKYGVTAFEQLDEHEPISPAQAGMLIDVNMQLMKEAEYLINRSSFVGMMRNITVEDLIRYAASVMGVTKIKMIPPDNTASYQLLTIPPEKGGFRVMFDFLQGYKGIYANGFRHYITNGILYIYPPFYFDVARTPRLNVIRVSENTHIGAHNYHKHEESGDLSIVSNTPLESKNLSNLGSENVGNTKSFVRSDGVFDGQVNKESMSLNNISAVMSSRADLSIRKDAAIPQYTKPTMNLFANASLFSESNTELLAFGWMNARIGMIEPGTPTTFIFDEKSVVMVKKGIVESVKYMITKVDRLSFACLAQLIIRSDPSPIPYQS